jgi:adenylate cyclase
VGPEDTEHRLAAILVADVVGYSRLMAEDQDATVRTVTAYREEVELLVRQHQGRLVDFTGDEFLAEFPTALESVRCAVEIQKVLEARNSELPSERRMQFRMGIHLGDVAVQGERLFGDGVNIAARLQALADPGGICISGEVHSLVHTKLAAGFDDRGDQSVKNIPDQVHVYQIPPQSEPEESARGLVSRGKRSHRLRSVLVTSAAILLLLGVGLWASWPRPLGLLVDLAGVSGPPVDPPLPDEPSLVVLPFENMSGDPEQEYFSDGITEDLTNEFARNPFLFVISRNSAFTYKGKRVKVEEVGRELGVRYVIEGSVRKAGDRVRITAQLIDATTGGHLWSERYDRELDDIFAVQSEIAQEILGAVGVEMAAAESQRVARKTLQDLTAVEASWKGQTYLMQGTREGVAKARLLYERAIEIDPDYAPFYAWLGNTYMTEYASAWSRDPALLDRAEELARRSIDMDPSWPAGHVTLGWVALFRGNSAEALASADRAIERAPNVEWPHALRGLALSEQGRMLEATASIRRALRLNPRRPRALLMIVAFVNLAAGRTEKGIEQMERVRNANPDNILSRLVLADHYEREGRHDQASIAVSEILRTVPDFSVENLLMGFPNLRRNLGFEAFVERVDALRKAGLPEE